MNTLTNLLENTLNLFDTKNKNSNFIVDPLIGTLFLTIKIILSPISYNSITHSLFKVKTFNTLHMYNINKESLFPFLLLFYIF